jgi:hypothetical protein
MRIDRFGLGDRWPRPQQAAAGALDHLPPDQWPMLASKWLAAGFDSQSLRQLAQLQTGESPARLRADRRSSSLRGGGWALLAGPGQPVPAEVRRLQGRQRAAWDAMELMPEVLRSLGFDPAPADEEFVVRCQKAVDIVQHDLDATGYGRYRMRARLGGGWPSTVHAALPDGSWGEGMSRQMEGAWLLVGAADSVSGTLKEVPEIEWPVCAVHGGHPGSIWDGEEPVDLIKKVAWWRCTNTGHPLAPVGQLTAETARTL